MSRKSIPVTIDGTSINVPQAVADYINRMEAEKNTLQGQLSSQWQRCGSVALVKFKNDTNDMFRVMVNIDPRSLEEMVNRQTEYTDAQGRVWPQISATAVFETKDGKFVNRRASLTLMPKQVMDPALQSDELPE